MVEQRVVWSDAARDDLRGIAFHIAQDNVENALRVVDAIDRCAAALVQLSTRGRFVPELRRLGERRYREVMQGPWRILYQVETSLVYVVAVVDGRRDVPAWLHEQAARFRMGKA